MCHRRDEALLEAKGGDSNVVTVSLSKYIKASALQKARQEWSLFGRAKNDSPGHSIQPQNESPDKAPKEKPQKKPIVALIRASGLLCPI